MAAGDARRVERRYFPAAVAAGLLVGVILGLLAQPLAVLILLGGGFALGYGARSYVSHKRRMEHLRRL